MPYRAMIWTIVTVALALLGVTLYVATVSPMLSNLDVPAAVTPATSEPPPEKALPRLVQGTMLLSFLLICLLLVIGFAATFREWVRFRTLSQNRLRMRLQAETPEGTKTPYVDAWKLAGERLQVDKTEPPAEDEDDDQDSA